MKTDRIDEQAIPRRHFVRDLTYGVLGAGLLAGVARSASCGSSSPVTRATPLAPDEPDWEPAYLKLHKRGVLRERAEALWAIMGTCALCPRGCGAKRLDGQRGFCRAPGTRLVISGHSPHFGEERPLVGRHGSGTIFFSHCNLRCVFCQNWEISHRGRGAARSVEDLAGMMLALQNRGCHNINVVTPTHYLPHIVKALDAAAERGLRIPLVYNTSGWERMEIVKQLDGVVDIYLPDIKYGGKESAAKYSAGADSYPELTKAAVLEMHRQVGVARTPADGVMRRGLMIRHLVMPNHTEDSEKIMKWIAAHLPLDTYVNIMAQYNPHYQAYDFPEIARRVTRDEYRQVVTRAKELGFTNLDSRSTWWL